MEAPRASPARAGRAARLTRASLVVAAIAVPVLLAASRTASTTAAFSDDANLTGTAFTTYTVPQPAITGCSPTPAGTTASRNATITWTGTTSPATTYGTAVSANLTTLGVTQSGTTTKTVVVNYNPGVTSNRSQVVTVTISPSLTASPTWTGPDATARFLTAANNNAPTCDTVPGDYTGPTAAFTAPDTTTRTAAAEQTYISGASGCANNSRPACGTMSDTSTITNVDYILQRVQSGTTQCWTGSAYASDCTTWRVGTIATQTTWRLSGTNATVYATPGGAFTIDVRVTDAWGNATTITRSFTVTP